MPNQKCSISQLWWVGDSRDLGPLLQPPADPMPGRRPGGQAAPKAAALLCRQQQRLHQQGIALQGLVGAGTVIQLLPLTAGPFADL